MKTRFLLPLCLAGLAHGQVYTPPPAEDKPAPASTPKDTAPPAEKKNPPPARSGRKSRCSIRPPRPSPSAAWPSRSATTACSRRGSKNTSASRPESDEAAAKYRQTIAEILATISPFRTGGPDLYAAFKQLPGASAYPGDANLCGSLAESIYMAMLAKQDVNGLTKLNRSMEDEKKAIIAEGDWKARHERDIEMNDTKDPKDKGKASKPQPESRVPASNSLKYTDTLRRIAEIEALKKANIVRTEAGTIRTKAQYQVSMIQWFVQRRYEHVLMAARFYNQIWKDGDATLRMDKNSDVSKLFSESVGVSPTVASLDSLSNEAIRETGKYIEAFDLMLSRNELHNASQRLMEAYALGEYLSPVATLSLEKKRRVAEYVRDFTNSTARSKPATTPRPWSSPPA